MSDRVCENAVPRTARGTRKSDNWRWILVFLKCAHQSSCVTSRMRAKASLLDVNQEQYAKCECFSDLMSVRAEKARAKQVALCFWCAVPLPRSDLRSLVVYYESGAWGLAIWAVLLYSIHSKINLDYEDHKIVPISLKDKLYTSLEITHLDLHIHLTHYSLF